MSIKFTVETIDSAYAGRVPWDKARRCEGLSERAAITMFNRLSDWYHDGPGWSGHVRVIGSDDWQYQVMPPCLGERATLARAYHLDDM